MAIVQTPLRDVRTDAGNEGTFYLADCREVLAAIGGTASFIDERVATDDMAKSPNMGAAYETEGADASRASFDAISR